MKKVIFFLGLLLVFSNLTAQDTLTLFQCYELAKASNPMVKEKALVEASRDLKSRNLTTNWYPSLDLNGKYTWQNEVVELGLALPVPGFEMPEMPHYNYKLTLDIQQTLYDGGAARAGRLVEDAATEVSRQQIEVELNKLKEQVNQVYFYILVLQQQERIFLMKADELKQKMNVFISGLKNGVLLASDLDIFKAEILKVEQQIREIRINIVTGIKVLEELTGSKIGTATVFSLPEIGFPENDRINRPEHLLFDLQINNLDATKTLTGTQRMPKVFAFGQLGYGNPALNFFRDEFRSYYILGAGLQWKIWDWKKNSRERELLTVQQDIIRSRKESFDLNMSVKLSNDLGEIEKFREAVDTDREIVLLRDRIKKTAASQLENGIITSTDFLTELNAETQARMTLVIHEIQMIQAQVDFLITKGDL